MTVPTREGVCKLLLQKPFLMAVRLRFALSRTCFPAALLFLLLTIPGFLDKTLVVHAIMFFADLVLVLVNLNTRHLGPFGIRYSRHFPIIEDHQQLEVLEAAEFTNRILYRLGNAVGSRGIVAFPISWSVLKSFRKQACVFSFLYLSFSEVIIQLLEFLT